MPIGMENFVINCVAKSSNCLSPCHEETQIMGAEVRLLSFLTSAFNGEKWST
jgi:hypothetical protein